MAHVLIVDDDKTNLYLLKVFCRDLDDVTLEFASDGQEALERLEAGGVDIVITDLRMPVLSGDALLTCVKEKKPHLPVLVMTGYGTIEGAVDYLQRGADDYLTKPLSKEVFLHRLERVMERVALTQEVERLKRSMIEASSDALIGRSPKMVALKNQLPTLAQTEASVLIYGESGTGKEIVARAIHSSSRRRDRPFIAVNCGALPETLLESELFGVRRGAFTDAKTDSPGLADAADTGTLFLDEVGEIPLSVQVKLLRFLEQKEYKPVGSPKSRIANVRIVAATNRDLRRAVEAKSFREDLYYRLNVVPLHLPTLKERTGDVAILASVFLDRINRRFGKNVSLSAGVFRILESYSWPGNVRELENKIEQIVVMCTDSVVREDDVSLSADTTPLFDPSLAASSLASFKAAKRAVVDRFERDYLSSLLREENGHISNAAKRAGLDRKNLWQLMRRHRIAADSFRS